MKVKLDDRPALWQYEAAPEADIVLESRITLHRNLTSYAFSPFLSPEGRRQLSTRIHSCISRLASGEAQTWQWWDAETASVRERAWYIRRHLLLPTEQIVGSAVAVRADEGAVIRVNTEDHVQISVVHNGLQLARCRECADGYDDRLEAVLPFAFHDEFGYVTANPARLGTGMEVSVLLHLPALVGSRRIARILQRAVRPGLTLYTDAGEEGQVFQLSNQITLGLTEEELIRRVDNATAVLIQEERKYRRHWQVSKADFLRDRIYRAYGILRYAYRVTEAEGGRLAGAVQWGITSGLLQGPSYTFAALRKVLPAHEEEDAETSVRRRAREIHSILAAVKVQGDDDGKK